MDDYPKEEKNDQGLQNESPKIIVDSVNTHDMTHDTEKNPEIDVVVSKEEHKTVEIQTTYDTEEFNMFDEEKKDQRRARKDRK